MIEQIKTLTAHALKNSELDELTDFAGELADCAAAEILPYFRVPVSVEDKGCQSQFDPVTIADQAAEAAMRKVIKKHYPEHAILGEEHGYESGAVNLTWVLDPIDGTRAFITGMPLWGVLIALFDGTKPVLGVMDQPFMRERYIGVAGKSVCVSGSDRTLLQTRQCMKLTDAILMTTSPDMFVTADEKLAYQSLLGQLRMNRFGGDCYAYCMLARGFVDLVVEADLQPYDIQALIPIVEGAGGVITNWRGESACGGGQVVAAATAELHQQALAVLRPGAAVLE